MDKENKSKLELIGEIAQANNKNLELIEEINDLQQRINKAVEYIREETTRFTEAYVEDDRRINLGKSKYKIVNLSPTKVEKLLNILKGEIDG